ncbi:hypothetical protein ACOMHN_004543 [Nucella lapillus]
MEKLTATGYGQKINLSTVQLSKEQEQLLSRGPKFCPTPASCNERQLLDDSSEGLRRVRLKEYRYDEEAPYTAQGVPVR